MIDFSKLEGETVTFFTAVFEATILFEAGDTVGAAKTLAEAGFALTPVEQLKPFLDDFAVKATQRAFDAGVAAKFPGQ